MAPFFVDVFLAPVRDSVVAQGALFGLFLLILLDWCFGVGNAIAKHEFSSKVMREGIGHKCSELGFVLVGIISDGLFFAGLDIGLNGPILIAVCVYLIIMEIGSLMEVFAKMNPKLANSPVFHLLKSVHVVDDAKKAENAQ